MARIVREFHHTHPEFCSLIVGRHKGPALTYMARAPSDITKWNPGTRYVVVFVLGGGESDIMAL